MLLLASAALAAPCTATTSGPGWTASLNADLAGGALVKAEQRLTVDIPAIDQGDSAYEYNSDLNSTQSPMARIVLTEAMTAGLPLNHTLDLYAPEVYAPVEVMMGGLLGTPAAPLSAALRVSANGTTLAWYPAVFLPSPADLSGSNINVYRVSFMGSPTGKPDPAFVEPATVLMALQAAGSLRVETLVGKGLKPPERMPLPTKEDPANTEVAGSFDLTAASLGPALAALPGLQAQVGQAYEAGRCGDREGAQRSGGKK